MKINVVANAFYEACLQAIMVHELVFIKNKYQVQDDEQNNHGSLQAHLIMTNLNDTVVVVYFCCQFFAYFSQLF